MMSTDGMTTVSLTLRGGCYAKKVINLDKESEPDIYNNAQSNAMLFCKENVTLDENGKIDFDDKV